MRRILLFLLLVLLPAAAGAGAAPPDAAAPALSDDAVRSALSGCLAEQVAVPGADVFIAGIRLPEAARKVPGEILRASVDGTPRSGRGMPFSLFVRSGNGDVRELRGTADVSLQVPVLVAARALPTGTVLSAGDVAVRKRDYTGSAEEMLHAPADAVGRRVRWQLSGGVPLRRDYLEDPEALRRGDAVQIEAESGAVRISGKGISLQAGRVGDTVLVKNLSSGKEVAGRLSAGRVVKID